MNIIAVMLGGFFGAICRYMLGEWLHIGEGFPIGTFLVNMSGCFLLGMFLTYEATKVPRRDLLVLFVGTGFFGSFTTFSTFSTEVVLLCERGMVGLAIVYILLSVILGVLAAGGGWKLIRTYAAQKGEAK
ncbi:fluoride efflux transporter CrcB [Bacillus sp. FSL W7-1360]